MNVLSGASIVLKNVIVKKRKVRFALADLFRSHDFSTSDIKRLKLLLNGTLRHYYLLDTLAKSTLSEYQENDLEVCLFLLVLYELHYSLRTTNVNKVTEEALSSNEELHLGFKEDDLVKKIKEASLPFRFTKETVADPYKYLPLVYSVPPFIFSRFIKQYGNKDTLRILRNMSAHRPTYVRRNESKCDEESVLSSGLFTKSLFAENLYVYSGHQAFNSTDFSKKGMMYPCDLSYALFLEKLEKLDKERILLLLGYETELVTGLETLKGRKDLMTYYPDEIIYRKASYRKEKMGTKDVQSRLYSLSEEEELKKEEFSLVVLNPLSSHLGNLAEDSSSLAFLHEDDFSSFKEEQQRLLSDYAQVVKEGGTLAYMVPTLDKEEGTKLIHSFLNAHPLYELSEEREIFPDEYDSNGIYYALIKRL